MAWELSSPSATETMQFTAAWTPPNSYVWQGNATRVGLLNSGNNKINKEERLVRYHEWKKIQCKFWASLGTCCLVTVWTEEQWGSFWSLVVLKLLTSAADKNGQKILGFFLGLLFPNDEGLGVAVITQEPLLQPPSSLWLNNVPGNWK